MSEKLLAGIDIGGTKTAIVLSSTPPLLLSRTEFPTNASLGPDAAIRLILQSLHDALAKQGASPSGLLGIGVSCGGPLDPNLGLIQSPPNLSTWNDVPICNILQREFGVPCRLENDANAGALAELNYGIGVGVQNLVFLTMGTGIGAGIIVNGQLLRGASNSAGEIGHVRLTRSGPTGHGRPGTVEGWASGGGMAQLAKMYIDSAIRNGKPTTLAAEAQATPFKITAYHIAEAARNGDEVAKAVVKKVGERLGQTLSILIDLLNPECISIGGLALRFGEDLLQPARAVVRREALRSAAERCRILPSSLQESIGDVAALCVALQLVEETGLRTPRKENPTKE